MESRDRTKISIRLLASTIVPALVLATMSTAGAGATKSQDPTTKLAIWTGHWAYTEQDFKTPYSDAHIGTGIANCSWAPNREFIICDYFNHNPKPGLPVNDIAVLSYSPSAKTYTHVGVFADSKPVWQRMTVDGDTWITSIEIPYKGKTLIYRTVYVYANDDTRTDVTAEISSDNGRTWTTVTRFKAHKIGSS
ncbi:MAG TPA: hypothetical protein VEV38_12025 [Candidatus Eremiobacteraceae bacterium]|nr:hypothetical protein [Candidatus Eremiobacteraceae bacterium]